MVLLFYNVMKDRLFPILVHNRLNLGILSLVVLIISYWYLYQSYNVRTMGKKEKNVMLEKLQTITDIKKKREQLYDMYFREKVPDEYDDDENDDY